MNIQITDFWDRLVSRGGPWAPKSTAQRAFLECPAQLVQYGGAAGSLKSESMLVDAIKYHQNPKYRGIVFRKTYPEIEFLMDRTRELYSNLGGRFYEAEKRWKWPWGAVLEFRHLDKDKDVYKHQGPEYQFVGFDESTHFKEFQIRYLLNSRMRSTENIPTRMRLPTNPGNVGGGYQKLIFQGRKCVHCILKAAEAANIEPKWLPDSRKPFDIYKDAKWPSDNKLIEHTTCFIPGRVRDHTLFGIGGGEYARKLRGLSAAFQEALLEGCWEAFEGQFFDCWDHSTHYISRDSVCEQKWWPHWVSTDYGFAHAAASYLFTKSPDGIVYTLAEHITHRRRIEDLYVDLVKMWGDKNIRAWFLSPDAFDHDGKSGDDFSGAERASQRAGIPIERAYNDRISGAGLMRTLLSEYRWFICDTCELLPVSISTRVHDEKKPEDVAKVDTEDEDDAYDGARYGIASFINPGKKPLEEILREKQENEWSSDPTTAMMQYRMFMAKQGLTQGPISYRSR